MWIQLNSKNLSNFIVKVNFSRITKYNADKNNLQALLRVFISKRDRKAIDFSS